MLNLTEAIQKIKTVGAKNVRVVPMANQPAITGMHVIEVKDGGSWVGIVSGLSKTAAEDIVRQATNRVICG